MSDQPPQPASLDREALERLVAEHGGKVAIGRRGKPIPDAWEFPSSLKARRFTKEASAIGWDVWQDIDLAGLYDDTKGTP